MIDRPGASPEVREDAHAVSSEGSAWERFTSWAPIRYLGDWWAVARHERENSSWAREYYRLPSGAVAEFPTEDEAALAAKVLNSAPNKAPTSGEIGFFPNSILDSLSPFTIAWVVGLLRREGWAPSASMDGWVK